MRAASKTSRTRNQQWDIPLNFLTTVSRKLLLTGVFSILNEDNLYSFNIQVDRTQNIISILEDCRRSWLNVQLLFMCGSVSHQRSHIKFHSIWQCPRTLVCYNLWYSRTDLNQPLKMYKTRGDLLAIILMFFLLLCPISLDHTKSTEVRNHRKIGVASACRYEYMYILLLPRALCGYFQNLEIIWNFFLHNIHVFQF